MNAMYIKSKYGVCLSKAARDFKSLVTLETRKQLPDPLPFGDKDVLKLEACFTINTRFFVRDLDNMLKLTIDGIFSELGLNDSRIIELNTRKLFKKESQESIEITISKSNLKYD